VKELIRDQDGFAVIVMFLILIPLLIAVIVGSTGFVNSVTVSDVDLQEAVACAVKSAAGTANEESQAEGIPRINNEQAHELFRDTLARNLGLDPLTLAPLENSAYAKAPSYELIVYNGYDDYALNGAEGAKLYCFDGSTSTETSLSYSGFPVSFAITQSGITPGITLGAGGAYTVELESPGVVALATVEARKIVGNVPVKAQRWASARIVCKEGACRVNNY
jgi:hypothetical protein